MIVGLIDLLNFTRLRMRLFMLMILREGSWSMVTFHSTTMTAM